MAKSWNEMTPAERLADRIAKNREIDRRVSEKIANEVPRGSSTRKPAVRSATARTAFERFQEIKRTEGIDAAADYVRAHKA
jgi:hypothetical protein